MEGGANDGIHVARFLDVWPQARGEIQPTKQATCVSHGPELDPLGPLLFFLLRIDAFRTFGVMFCCRLPFWMWIFLFTSLLTNHQTSLLNRKMGSLLGRFSQLIPGTLARPESWPSKRTAGTSAIWSEMSGNASAPGRFGGTGEGWGRWVFGAR